MDKPEHFVESCGAEAYDKDEMDKYLETLYAKITELEMFEAMAEDISKLRLEWAKKIANHRS